MIVEYLPVESIEVDNNQPRKIFDDEPMMRLQESIREKGIEVPLMVREHEDNNSLYILVDGERRFRSAKALSLKEVPCIIDSLKPVHPQVQEVDVMSKQLRLDFLKNKLTGEELDVALYDLWLSLETVSPEALTAMGIKSGHQRDWRIPYISKETGVGYTQITMSLNKEDFKKRNESFHKKVIEDIKNDPTKSKRYNRILGETSRHEGFREDDSKRKTVIEEYLNEAIPGDGKVLRDSLKKISETESPSEEQVREMFGLEDSSVDETLVSKSNPDLSKHYANVSEINKFYKELTDVAEKNFMAMGTLTKVFGHLDRRTSMRLKEILLKSLQILDEHAGV